MLFFLFLLKTIGEVVLTSTHNLCFGAKIRKIGIPLHTPALLYIKVGYKGVFISLTCFPDGHEFLEKLIDWGLTSHQQLRSYGDGFLEKDKIINV